MPHLHAACPPFPPWAGRAASTHCADDLRISCASPRSPKACPCLGCWPSSALLPLRGWHYVNRRSGICFAGFPKATSLRSPKHWASAALRPEEHPSDLQSLMRISYAVFCLNYKTNTIYAVIVCLAPRHVHASASMIVEAGGNRSEPTTTQIINKHTLQ